MVTESTPTGGSPVERVVSDQPAFPAAEYMVNHEVDQKTIMRLRYTQGMALRDYFAAKAMQGFCSNAQEQCWMAPPDKVAEWSYTQADAMLAARVALGANARGNRRKDRVAGFASG